MRASLSVFLAWLLFSNSLPAKPKTLAALNNAQAPTSQKPSLKEKVLEIPAGSMVEVRLKSKEKLRGRLGEVSNEGFTVKLAKGNKIEDRKLAFEDVKSFKAVDMRPHTNNAAWVVVGIAAGAVAVLVILFVYIRTHE